MHSTNRIVSLIALLTCLLSAIPSQAADISQPDAGSIMREIKPEPQPPTQPAPSLQLPPANPSPQAETSKILLQGWRISGASLIPAETLQQLLSPYLQQMLTLAELRNAAQSIDRYYQQQGYYSRTLLPAQTIRDGIVEIIVLEGKLGKIEINDPNHTYDETRLQNTLQTTQGLHDYLKLTQIQRSILLLNDLPGGSVSATLKPGSQTGESDLFLKVTPSPLFSGNLDYANAGIRAIGQNQFGGTLYVNNPLNIGDLVTLRLQGGSDNIYGRFAYSLPIGYSGLRVGVQTASLAYTLGDPFQELSAGGNSHTGGIFANYPLIRGLTANLTVNSGFDDRRYYNTSLDTVISNKEVQAGYIGLNGDYRDPLWLGGFSQYSVNMVAGNLDLSADPEDAAFNQATAKAAGSYQKFVLKYSRLQTLGKQLRFFAGINSQMADKNLDSSEKFSLGGPNAVRAYPVNEALGDEGYLLNVELRYDAYQNIEVIGFIDHGGTVLHATPWTGSNIGAPNQYTLSGGGIGVNWKVPGNFMIKGVMAERIGNNPGQSANGYDSDGSHKAPRFWVSLSKYF